MNLKLYILAAAAYGLQSISPSPRSIKVKKTDNVGRVIPKQINNLDSYNTLANYNKALVVESNLK